MREIKEEPSLSFWWQKHFGCRYWSFSVIFTLWFSTRSWCIQKVQSYVYKSYLCSFHFFPRVSDLVCTYWTRTWGALCALYHEVNFNLLRSWSNSASQIITQVLGASLAGTMIGCESTFGCKVKPTLNRFTNAEGNN